MQFFSKINIFCSFICMKWCKLIYQILLHYIFYINNQVVFISINNLINLMK